MDQVTGWGAIIIGDEIMRGKRQDKHFGRAVEVMAARGLHLDWVEYLGDDRARLTGALQRTMASGDVVFSFGGIGVTPDDHTRQAVAAAAGVALVLHPEAEREIRARMAEMNQEATPARLELGTFPAGSHIIPNPFNRIPGFSFAHHHFFPGFPQMAWPMLEWVLDTHYRAHFHRVAEAEFSLIVWEGLESQLLDLMRSIEAEFAGVTVFSLPSLGSETMRRHIELGVRGAPALAESAFAAMRAELERRGLEMESRK